MKSAIFFLILFASLFCLHAEQRARIDFEYPSMKGDFYVTGKISFAPEVVSSESHIAVRDADRGEEIPTRIDRVEEWPDGSLLEVIILFPANASRQKKYVLSYGNDIVRKRIFTQTAVLPVVNSTIGGTPKTTESLDMNVGEMLVKVDRSPGIRYYWHVLPIGILILLTAYRALRNSRAT